MKRLIILLLTLIIVSGLMVPPVQAAELDFGVDKISYYGYLVDRNSSQPVDSPISITFRIYEEESGGTPIWEETHSSVKVENGFFDVSLGGINSLAGVDFNRDLWLGVEVNSDGEMTPRHKLPKLQPEMPDDVSGNGSNETSIEQIYEGQFGHEVIEISIDHHDMRSGENESPLQESHDDSIITSPDPPKFPRLNITALEFDVTHLQTIPFEEERVFDNEDLRVYSNSPRAPGFEKRGTGVNGKVKTIPKQI